MEMKILSPTTSDPEDLDNMMVESQSVLSGSTENKIDQNILERLQQIINNEPLKREQIKMMLIYLSGCRDGLTKNDLCEIMNLDEVTFGELKSTFDFLLVEENGMIVLESSLKDKIISHYSVTDSRQVLIDYFMEKFLIEVSSENNLGNSGNSDKPKSLIRIQIRNQIAFQLPWLLLENNNLAELKSLLTNIYFFDMIFYGTSKPQLINYFKLIKLDTVDIFESYLTAINEYSKNNPSGTGKIAYFSHKLGEYFMLSGQYSESLYFLRKALEIKREIWGEYSNEFLITLNEIGRVYFRTDNFTEAKDVWKKVHNTREKNIKHKSFIAIVTTNTTNTTNTITDEDYNSLAISMSNLALIYTKTKNLGNFSEDGLFSRCEELYFGAIDNYMKMSKPNVADIAIAHHNLGLLYAERQNYTKSEQMYLKALKVKEDYYGQNNIEITLTLNNLGLLNSKVENYPNAISYYLRAISIRENILGPDDVEIGLYAFNLSICYFRIKDFENARIYIDRAYKIRVSIFGPNHPKVAVVKSWIGII